MRAINRGVGDGGSCRLLYRDITVFLTRGVSRIDSRLPGRSVALPLGRSAAQLPSRSDGQSLGG